MAHDAALLAEVRAWLIRAKQDVAIGEFELTAVPPFTNDIAFHAQQAVEKALKGFLAWHGVPFRKTHNLVELGHACCTLDASLEIPVREAAPLTEYAWRFRYPGDPEEASVEEAESALAAARGVLSAVLARVPPEAAP
jgi:HEPN domain-containing protein